MNDIDLESSYSALSSLEELVSIVRRVSMMSYFTIHSSHFFSNTGELRIIALLR